MQNSTRGLHTRIASPIHICASYMTIIVNVLFDEKSPNASSRVIPGPRVLNVVYTFQKFSAQCYEPAVIASDEEGKNEKLEKVELTTLMSTPKTNEKTKTGFVTVELWSCTRSH